MSQKIGIFGGSFNPPHVGHVLLAALVLSTRDFDRLIVVPTYMHPFAKSLASFEDRIAMCTLAMGWLPRVEISRVEETLGGESKTLRTLEHLREAHADWSMELVMGSDTFAETPKWYRFDRVRELAPPLVIGRAHADEPPGSSALLPAVSSTDVRTLVAAGAWERLGELVPRSVLSLILDRKLYTAPLECESTSLAPAK